MNPTGRSPEQTMRDMGRYPDRVAALHCGTQPARLRNVVAESSRATLLSRVVRLRREYEGAIADGLRTMILKVGRPHRDATVWISGGMKSSSIPMLPLP
jgi:hypothetical protein